MGVELLFLMKTPRPRRSLAVVAAVSLCFAGPALSQGIERMPVVGYADRLSVPQGETIRFMVSSKGPRYRADLVRLIHGDTQPGAPGLKEERVEADINQTYPGRRQELAAGSYVHVEDHPSLRLSGSFDPRAAFVFEGIGPDEPIGDTPCLVMEHGAAGLEFDRFDHVLGTPAHALLLATATGFSAAYDHVVEEVLVADSRQSGTVNPRVRADMVYFEYPNGGAVFSTSSISWDSCLSYNGYINDVSRITENVLNRFQSDRPLPETEPEE